MLKEKNMKIRLRENKGIHYHELSHLDSQDGQHVQENHELHTRHINMIKNV